MVADLASMGASITTVYSRSLANASRFAQVFNIEHATDDFNRLLGSDEVDVIYLATPFALHHDMACAAIDAGKHVLVEKPMAMRPEQVADLFRRADRQGTFLMEAMWMRFNPTYVALLHALAEGIIGEPRSVRAGFGFPFPNDGGSKFDLTRSGGALLDQGIYPVTLALDVLGAPTSLAARGDVRDDGLDLAQHATLEFSGGRFAHCASSISDFVDPSATISGTTGWVHIPAPFWTVPSYRIHAGDPATMFTHPELVEFPADGNGYGPMLVAVTDAIRAGLREHPAHDASATLATFTTLDAIHRAASTASAG
ncbi:Gfo/Idh/MocA family oxidoreductase [Rathayibacter sp. ZW T2_19]|uniref:Gfo/Idh/MocA family oxidoreductase n=1 Tax=Rathayibacter rubneri TaxID=2950106 RepID=A0A9X2DTZ0_9MICO|nr:Gfo/Idh/MocA family oxidoreductase [Rathayibacter rubneri]